MVKNKQKTKKNEEIQLDDDATEESTGKITPRKSSRKRKPSAKLREDDDDVTPEKIPKPLLTPRKSRRSKDMSPPPLRHRQNRMPEQTELVKPGESFLPCLTMLM